MTDQAQRVSVMRYIGRGLFLDSAGQRWPLWAVNAARTYLELQRLHLARFNSQCWACHCHLNEGEPIVLDNRKALCRECA